METSELDTLASDFFGAVLSRNLGRVAELYDPEAEIWHSVSKQIQNREENLKLLALYTSRFSRLNYDIHSRDFFPGGLVQRHTIEGQTNSGKIISIPVCIIIYADNGKIQRIFEYIDSAAAASIFKD